MIASSIHTLLSPSLAYYHISPPGNPIATSEDFVEAMRALPRPMTISLYRYIPGGAAGGASSSGSRSSMPALNDAEKEKRREAMVAAALQREKSWDKKVANAKDKRGAQMDHTGRPIYDHRYKRTYLLCHSYTIRY